VNVGICDYGIDTDHEDLAGAIHPTLSFGPNDGDGYNPSGPHGSATAGIVGAVGNNSIGISGVATPKGGRILVPMRPNENDEDLFVTSFVIDALQWATADTVFPQVPIINLSYGLTWNAHDPPLADSVLFSLRDACRNVYRKGIFLNVAAGNYWNQDRFIYPAQYVDYSYAVAAVHCDGSRPPTYWKGTYIDASAPGGHVDPNNSDGAYLKTTWGDHATYKYYGEDGARYFGGTSGAAPHVAGIAALLWSKEPSLTNEDIANVLNITASYLGDAEDYGHGLVRADTALMLVSEPNEIVHDGTTASRIDSVATRTLAFMNIPCISESLNSPETFTVHVYEMVGYASFSDSALAVWPRGRQSYGLRNIVDDYDGFFYDKWAQIVGGTVTAAGCSLRAYTYKFFKDGEFQGWYPVNNMGYSTCAASLSPVFAYTYVIDTGSSLASQGSSLNVLSGGPNPFNPRFNFSVDANPTDRVVAEVYGISGRRLRVLEPTEAAESGGLRYIWDGRDSSGRDVSSGVYFLRVLVGGEVLTRKLQVVR